MCCGPLFTPGCAFFEPKPTGDRNMTSTKKSKTFSAPSKEEHDLLLKAREVICIVRNAPPADVEEILVEALRPHPADVVSTTGIRPAPPPRPAPTTSGFTPRAERLVKSPCPCCGELRRMHKRPSDCDTHIIEECADCVMDYVDRRRAEGKCST
jgi:hypothetical protein